MNALRKSILSAAVLFGVAGMARAQETPAGAAPPATEPTTKPASVAADQTTPRGTMKVFLTAITTADGDSIRKLFVTSNDVEKSTIDAVIARSQADKNFREALIKTFGATEASKLVGEPEKDLVKGMEVIDGASEQINGDSATVDTREGEGSQPVKLKKANGTWQLDAGEFVRDRDPVTAHQHIDDMNFASGLMTKFAADINGGKFKSVEDAQEQIQVQMMAAMQQRAAARAPATAPAGMAPGMAPATQPGK